MREGEYQTKLIKKLRKMFPDCIVLKNDSGYLQGIPDLVVFYQDRWAMLEVKTSSRAHIQPNQEHYVYILNEMSFAAFIYPENEEAILDELQFALEPRRAARLSKR